MAKQVGIQQKQTLLGNPAITHLILDILKEYDSNSTEDITDVEYEWAIRNIVNKLKSKYKRQVQGQVVASKQVDLEELIARVKSEEPWKNKMIKK